MSATEPRICYMVTKQLIVIRLSGFGINQDPSEILHGTPLNAYSYIHAHSAAVSSLLQVN